MPYLCSDVIVSGGHRLAPALRHNFSLNGPQWLRTPVRAAKLAPVSRVITSQIPKSLVCFSRSASSPQDERPGRKQKTGVKNSSGAINKSKQQPVTLLECLQQAASLNEATHPGLLGQCMRSFASLPRRSVTRADVPACLQALQRLLPLALDPRLKRKPTLLSDMGKLLQAQPGLKSAVKGNQVLQEHISALFSLATDGLETLPNAIDVSQLATAQLKMGHYSGDFWARLERSGLGSLPAREFSNVLYASAKLHQQCDAPYPSSSFHERLWQQLRADGHELASEMNAQELSNTWWALGTLGLAVPADVQNALHSATIRVAPSMVPQAVANTWFSFAKLCIDVPSETHDALQSATIRLAPAMVPQAVSNIWWSYATLGLDVPPEADAALQSAIIRVAPAMVPQAVANISWSFAKLGLEVPPETRDALQSATVRVAPSMDPQAVANVWFSFATLGLELPLEASNALLSATIRVATEMVAQDAAMVWWSLATLTCQVPHEAFDALCSATVWLSPSMDPQDVGNTLWAMGVLVAQGHMQGQDEACVDDEVVSAVAARLLQLHKANAAFLPEHMSQVHSASQLLDLEKRLGAPGQRLLQAYREATIQRVADHKRGSTACGDETGASHGAVLEALRSRPELSECDLSSEVAVGDSSRRVDILLQGRGVRVAVEVDGPTHFVKDAAGRAVREDGATTLRNWQLRAWGYSVLSVPVMDKTPAQLRSAKHTAWLLHELRSRGAVM